MDMPQIQQKSTVDLIKKLSQNCGIAEDMRVINPHSRELDPALILS